MHHRRLSEHHFVIGYRDTLATRHFEPLQVVRIDGYVQCRNGVVLEVTKELQARYDGSGRMYVRCYLYCNIGILPGRHLLPARQRAEPSVYGGKARPKSAQFVS